MPSYGSGKFPYPNSSAVPDVPADVLLLGQRIDKIASGWTLCADATARAALVTDGDAYEGLHVYQIDTKVHYIYRSVAWVPWESPWITFSPTLANLTIGTGGSALSSARYRYVGGQVEAEYKFVLGNSGFSVGSVPTATLPVTAETLTHTLMVLDGWGSMYDTSGADLRVAFMQLTSTTIARFAYSQPTGIGYTVPSSTTPWTWAAGDAFHQIIRYTPA